MSRTPQLESVAQDVLVSADLTSFNSPARTRPVAQSLHDSIEALSDERQPLLGARNASKKPFYRARPLWIVPFAVMAALVRGMTLAARVEVYTQLSCNALHRHPDYNHTTNGTPTVSTTLPSANYMLPYASLYQSIDPQLHFTPVSALPLHAIEGPPLPNDEDEDGDEDPRELPSLKCISDPAVQKGAAKLQVMMTTTMGLLSALTNGFWGGFGERYGRTRVLALATLGLFLTDLIFIFVSSPHPLSSPFHSHATKFLLVSPIVEGLLGGWATLQSATSAYISDCTSPGSRAHVFSRFSGVFYLGFSIGPMIGGWLIRHPILGGDGRDVTSVFRVAIIFSAVNLFLTVFVFPESLSKEMQAKARIGKTPIRDLEGAGADEEGAAGALQDQRRGGFLKSFISPLAVFLPVRSSEDESRDWSLTMIALALFGYMLSMGVYQIKYLYAEHVYGWEAEQLSYYISFMGGLRAVHLLFFLPFLIATFKPKAPLPLSPAASQSSVTEPVPEEQTQLVKVSPCPSIAKEISFDLILTRLSLFVDMLSNFFVIAFPVPSTTGFSTSSISTIKSQGLFVFASSLSSIGASTLPAAQSLALCIVQARSLAKSSSANQDAAQPPKKGGAEGTGQLFGAIAVLQATGQMILGPLMFGLVYGTTVASYPKAIFALAGGILTVAFVLLFFVHSPEERKKKSERGRSRVSKDLRPIQDILASQLQATSSNSTGV